MSNKGIAIVTGGAQGIGKGVALRLADDGFDVAVNDLPSNKENLDAVVKEIQGKGRRSLALFADVSIEEEVKAMVDRVVKELGGLDVVSCDSSQQSS
jgi:NAD(P)-dependent dehydrogenase (short-subunit alcohol dehydrogenase family)